MLQFEDFNWKTKDGMAKILKLLGKVFMAIGMALIFLSLTSGSGFLLF